MKATKYIISFCVLFVGLLVIGESHTFRLNNFYTPFHHTTLYLQLNTTQQEMVGDILRAAERNHIEVFAFRQSLHGSFQSDYDIYGTSGVERDLNHSLNIVEGEYASLFLGNIQFAFHPFEDIPEIGKFYDYYLIGDYDQALQFKRELINKYAGNLPQAGYESHDLRDMIILLWLLMIGIVLFLTIYDVIYQKKENLIRVSMGERIAHIFWRNVLIDSVVLSIWFAVILYILSKYTYVFFRFDLSLAFFGILLSCNALLYLNLYRYKLKEVFSNARSSKKLLTLNYGLKLVTAVLTIFIIFGNITLIFQSYELYKQKSFFKDHADYYYTRLEHRLVPRSSGFISNKIDDDVKMQASFYRKYFDSFHAILLANAGGSLNGRGIVANRNAFEYVSNQIKELKEAKLTKSIYFLVPEEMSEDDRIIDQLKLNVKFFEGEHFQYDYDVIYYEDNVEIISIDENFTYGSELIPNPLIIYNNMTAEELDRSAEVLERWGDEGFGKRIYLNDIMYRISDDEFNRFVKEHDLEGERVVKTNVLDKYENSWRLARRILVINFVFSMLVLFLEMIIIGSIIKLEYEVHAIELSIKKVFGYGKLEKHKRIVWLTLLTTLLATLSSVIVAVFAKLDGAFVLAVGGVMILALELAVILYYIHQIEKARIQKILKGGNI